VTGATGGGTLRRDALANRERVLAAAVTALLREGSRVSMATIAADAGVGVGTLYRHYPGRDALLAALTERSFHLVLDAAEDAARGDEPAITALDRFLDRTIEHCDQLVLPLHGGPAQLSRAAANARDRVHATLQHLLERGRRDGSIHPEISASDVIMFGAMLAQPLSAIPDWTRTARRQKTIFLRGIGAPARGVPVTPPHDLDTRRHP
jgi:AcrR family transcriptional regulator